MASTQYKVGDKLYALNAKGEIVDYAIKKVGRKYLTVSRAGHSSCSVYKDTLEVFGDSYSWREEFRKFYRTKEDLLAAIEKRDLLDKFRRFFDMIYGNAKQLSLDTLRQMDELVHKDLGC